MSIEKRPSGEQAYATSEQAGKILLGLSTMLYETSWQGNLKRCADLKEELDVRLFRVGVHVEGDENYLTLASILFFNRVDGYIQFALYEVEKIMPEEERILRQTFIGSPDEQLPPFGYESSAEYRQRQRMEHRSSSESQANEGTAEMIIDWLKQRNLNNGNGKNF